MQCFSEFDQFCWLGSATLTGQDIFYSVVYILFGWLYVSVWFGWVLLAPRWSCSINK